MAKVKPKLNDGSRKLREACAKRGMRQADLVRALRQFDITQTSTINYYQGNTTPPENKMYLIAQVLNINYLEVHRWYYPNGLSRTPIEEFLDGKA